MDDGSILVTGAAGQLGSVGRPVTGLLLGRGFPVNSHSKGIRGSGPSRSQRFPSKSKNTATLP